MDVSDPKEELQMGNGLQVNNILSTRSMATNGVSSSPEVNQKTGNTPDPRTFISGEFNFDQENSVSHTNPERKNQLRFIAKESDTISRSDENQGLPTIINNVAVAYRNMGLYEEARSLLEYGVKSFYRFCPTNRIELATLMDNLAAVYSDLDMCNQAEKIAKRSLNIREMELDPKSAEIAISYDNLGLIYSQQGKFKEAKKLYHKALEIFESSRHPHSIDVATCLNNLATLLFNNGEIQGAKRHYLRAIAIGRKITTGIVPELGIYFNNLAEVHRKEGDLQTAQHLFDLSLSVLKECYGSDHPDTVLVKENLEGLGVNKDYL